MSSPTLLSKLGLRIAVEGCGHGVLHEIYASVTKACELKGWPDVDLLIIGGDFQACLCSSAIYAILI
jgi:lariat debranching enzyme